MTYILLKQTRLLGNLGRERVPRQRREGQGVLCARRAQQGRLLPVLEAVVQFVENARWIEKAMSVAKSTTT